MDLGLKNKIALVSGSTAGAGYAIGVALARELRMPTGENLSTATPLR